MNRPEAAPIVHQERTKTFQDKIHVKVVLLVLSTSFRVPRVSICVADAQSTRSLQILVLLRAILVHQTQGPSQALQSASDVDPAEPSLRSEDALPVAPADILVAPQTGIANAALSDFSLPDVPPRCPPARYVQQAKLSSENVSIVLPVPSMMEQLLSVWVAPVALSLVQTGLSVSPVPATLALGAEEIGAYLVPRDLRLLAVGNTACKRKKVIECPQRHFLNVDGDCQTCDKNFFQNRATKTCEKCPSGSVSQGGSVDSCTQCTGGQVDFDTLCVCPDGRFLVGNACKKCPPGTASSKGISGDPNLCPPCPPDTVTNQQGASSCDPCPEGFVANSARTACVPCADGLVFVDYTTDEFLRPPSWGRCVSRRTNCPPNLTRQLDGGRFSSCQRN